MKSMQTRAVRLFLLLGALTLVLSACYRDSTLRWTEDVILPDERVIALKREQQFDEGGFVSAHWFEFQHPVTRELVRWNDDGFFSLVALFLVKDVPHILVSPTFGKHNEQAGCPFPSIFIFRYEAPSWVQVPYAHSPVRFVARNVISDPKAGRKLIEANAFKVPSGSVDVSYAQIDAPRFSIDLDKFPVQNFKCPAQKRISIQ